MKNKKDGQGRKKVINMRKKINEGYREAKKIKDARNAKNEGQEAKSEERNESKKGGKR